MTNKSKTRKAKGKTQRWKKTNNGHTKRPDIDKWSDGSPKPVLNGEREGWWRYNDHYDRDGYCDNPGRGY